MFYKMQGIVCPAKELSASQKIVSSMELTSFRSDQKASFLTLIPRPKLVGFL